MQFKVSCLHTTFTMLIQAIMDFHMCLKVLHLSVFSSLTMTYLKACLHSPCLYPFQPSHLHFPWSRVLGNDTNLCYSNLVSWIWTWSLCIYIEFFSFTIMVVAIAQLIPCPFHFAIQPLTNQVINLLVICQVPQIFQYKVSISFFAFGRIGLVVLKVLTWPNMLVMFVVVTCSLVRSCLRSKPFFLSRVISHT